MYHHFDTKLATEDPSLNLRDFYLFQGAPDTTVMAMTVPDVALSAPDTLHSEGLYAFRLDLTGDAREDVVFKFRLDEPRHASGDEHVHVQKFQVRRATGDAIGGNNGELLIEGDTGKVHSESGIRAFVGIAPPDMLAADAVGTRNLQNAFYNEHRYDGDAFRGHGQNFFHNRNITAIVLEVPNHLIGEGTVHAWATVSLYGHAPEMQVSRWGLPMITHLFLNDPATRRSKRLSTNRRRWMTSPYSRDTSPAVLKGRTEGCRSMAPENQPNVGRGELIVAEDASFHKANPAASLRAKAALDY